MSKDLPNWTGAADIKAQVQKLWERGDLLASMISNDIEWPRRLVLKTPTSTDIANNFDSVRKWISEVRNVPFCRIEMREVNHRIFGRNDIPLQAWIESLDDAVSLISKQKQKTSSQHSSKAWKNDIHASCHGSRENHCWHWKFAKTFLSY